MLQLVLQADGNSGKAEMFIDYQSECVDFTVLSNDLQFDFCIEKEEWELLKNFIETSIKNPI